MDSRLIELKQILSTNIKYQNLLLKSGDGIGQLKMYSDIFFDALSIAQESGIDMIPKEVTILFKEYITEVINGILQKDN